ncbi:hypothetical protein QVD17_03561 [Tagetes erecta]|uniref:Cystatin domain-containing protein n=1 Tax=Tagetes erecta TaxID=13708 RepID=A0AAD8P8S7_TARER|nr:hypothetical protein QVD17_03561 [Tagetes erecta]
MISNYQTILLTMLIFCSGSIFGNEFPTFSDKTHVDKWRPMKNLTDTKMVEIGKFAVREHNSRDKTKLMFYKLVEGEIVEGYDTKYNLTITAKDGVCDNNIAKNYTALVVEEQFMKILHLVSFRGPI